MTTMNPDDEAYRQYGSRTPDPPQPRFICCMNDGTGTCPKYYECQYAPGWGCKPAETEFLDEVDFLVFEPMRLKRMHGLSGGMDDGLPKYRH